MFILHVRVNPWTGAPKLFGRHSLTSAHNQGYFPPPFMPPPIRFGVPAYPVATMPPIRFGFPVVPAVGIYSPFCG